jgi:hypothetical protein
MAAQPLLYRWRLALMWDEELSAADRHVALTLALFMDIDGGSCRPGVRRLEWMTARKRATVISSIRNLERRSWLTVKRGGIGKNRGTSHYQARCPKGHLEHLPQGASLVASKVPKGATELFMSSGAPAAPPRREKGNCVECELGGGAHVDGCSLAS